MAQSNQVNISIYKIIFLSRQYIKRERELEDDLLKFMNEFQNLSVQSKCEEATRNVRMHLKRKRESSLKLQKEFSDIES